MVWGGESRMRWMQLPFYPPGGREGVHDACVLARSAMQSIVPDKGWPTERRADCSSFDHFVHLVVARFSQRPSCVAISRYFMPNSVACCVHATDGITEFSNSDSVSHASVRHGPSLASNRSARKRLRLKQGVCTRVRHGEGYPSDARVNVLSAVCR
jgi:hypothetical protein